MASARRTGTNENISTYGAGKDYTEGQLPNWEEATDVDITAGGTGQSEVLEVYKEGIGNALWDDYENLEGATTDADYFRIIRPAIGEGHAGIPLNDGSMAGFKSTVDAPLFRIDESYSQIQDIVGHFDINATSSRNAYGGGNNDADQWAYVGCLILKARNAGVGDGFGLVAALSPGKKGFFIDCLAHDCDIGVFQPAATQAAMCLYNTTVSENTDGFVNSDPDLPIILKNVIVENNTTNFSDSGGGFTKTTCTDDDGVTFVNAAGDDFHISSADTAAQGRGTDLSGDGDYAFDDDIDGEIITSWSIGFDSLLALAGTIIRLKPYIIILKEEGCL